jgi:hypothetical protein
MEKDLGQLMRDVTTNRWVIGGVAVVGAFLIGLVFQAQTGISSSLVSTSNHLSRITAILERIDTHGTAALEDHGRESAGKAHPQ